MVTEVQKKIPALEEKKPEVRIMQKADTQSDSPANYVKLYAQESTREIIKARITGKVFKMPDFEKIQQNPSQ